VQEEALPVVADAQMKNSFHSKLAGVALQGVCATQRVRVSSVDSVCVVLVVVPVSVTITVTPQIRVRV